MKKGNSGAGSGTNGDTEGGVGSSKNWLPQQLGSALSLSSVAVSQFIFESKSNGSMVSDLFMPYGPNGGSPRVDCEDKPSSELALVESKTGSDEQPLSARRRLLPSASMVFGGENAVSVEEAKTELKTGGAFMTEIGVASLSSPRDRMDQLMKLDSDSSSDEDDDSEEDRQSCDSASTTSSSSSLGIQPTPRMFSNLNVSSGQQEYIKACQKLGVRSISYLMDNFECEHVSLGHHHVGEKGTVAVAKALEHNHYISSLNMTNCFIGLRGAKALGEVLAKNPRLVSLDLSDNMLGNSRGLALAEGFKANRTIKSLILCNNKLGDKFVQAISHALIHSGNNSLVSLNLSKNQIGEKGAIEISELCAYNYTLLNLDLGWNNIKGKAAGVLFTSISVSGMSALKELNLSWNGIDDSIVETIGPLITSSPALQVLDLSHNRLTNVTATLAAQALVENTSLLCLQLGFNPLGCVGCLDLVQATKENTALRILGVENPLGRHDDEKQMRKIWGVVEEVINERPEYVQIFFEHPPKYRTSSLLLDC